MRNSNLGFVRRNILTTSEQVKSTAYKQLVRPVPEYNSFAWDSASDSTTSRLEAVQRRAARLIFGIRQTDQTSSTTGLLQRLNLQPLSKRKSLRRLAILFSQYHTTIPTPHCPDMYRPPNMSPVVNIQTNTSLHILTIELSPHRHCILIC